MLGTVKWTATFTGHGDPMAELYDKKGKVIASRPIPCAPPIACPFPIEDVEFGIYTAALAVGNDRYYYDEHEQVITIPNNVSHASRVEVSQANPDVAIVITVAA